ncbi:hypothetical protein AB0937_13025 [Streptomyces sp. NPDC047880]|uniref:hypothetical protein n=1 Tax=Streptomyces sp. NPDC047880 TaxID=3155626 RepID=UPI003454573F
MTQNTQQPGTRQVLGLRNAIILLLGVLTDIGAGVLTYLAQHSLPAAALAAGAGFGAGVLFFHTIIDWPIPHSGGLGAATSSAVAAPKTPRPLHSRP